MPEELKATTFPSFILDEMRKRDMGMREFADFVEVSHATISRYLSGKKQIPDPQFVIRLAKKTGVSVLTVLALAYPELAGELRYDPEIMILAERLDRLPEDIKNFILAAVERDPVLSHK